MALECLHSPMRTHVSHPGVVCQGERNQQVNHSWAYEVSSFKTDMSIAICIFYYEGRIFLYHPYCNSLQRALAIDIQVYAYLYRRCYVAGNCRVNGRRELCKLLRRQSQRPRSWNYQLLLLDFRKGRRYVRGTVHFSNLCS